MARRCWKHSRQKTGRPCVGRKGTVVSFPHCEQFVFVSARIGDACPPPPPPPSARFALQLLQRFGSFLKPLSAKNICSPAVNTNSAALRGPDSRKCGAEPRRKRKGDPDHVGTAPFLNPLPAAASYAVASAKALLSPGASRRVSCRSYAS